MHATAAYCFLRLHLLRLHCAPWNIWVNQALQVLQETHSNGDEGRRSDVGDRKYEPSKSKLPVSVQRRGVWITIACPHFCLTAKSRQSVIRYIYLRTCQMFNIYLSLPMDSFFQFMLASQAPEALCNSRLHGGISSYLTRRSASTVRT
ncbi:hypothetical protein DFH94DRAFT_761708 [Russula ochroleuca]|uniref:Secreted protein n=1 Tax=Russula ochroleuca TaxID=152965 RepID=A0A9P5MRC9_9AGAM|nr:hypothetical protein DFH94DRAFT_761708 [Russula ochroleuca]